MSLNSTDSKNIRKFGFIAFVLFGCLCSTGIIFRKFVPTYFFGFLSILGAGLSLAPSRLRSIYLIWQKISHLCGEILTIVMLTMAYYLVVTPAALLKLFISGRPLPLKPDKSSSTYWVSRMEPAQPKERFLKRY